MVHVRNVPRLTQLVRLVGEEAERENLGRDLILARLVEILLIEALRAASPRTSQPSLLRGLSDPRISAALRKMHSDIERSWTAADGVWLVAKNLLRSGSLSLEDVARRIGYGSAITFCTAFSRQVGQSPGRFMRTVSSTSQTAHA